MHDAAPIAGQEPVLGLLALGGLAEEFGVVAERSVMWSSRFWMSWSRHRGRGP